MQRGLSDQDIFLGEEDIGQAVWKMFRPMEAPRKATLQPVGLPAGCAVLSRSPASGAVTRAGLGLGDAAVFESFLLLEVTFTHLPVTPIKQIGLPSGALVASSFWSVIGSLSGMIRRACCVSSGNALSHNVWPCQWAGKGPLIATLNKG